MVEKKNPFLCRVFRHKFFPWRNTYWGGLPVWSRFCMRDGCDGVERMGEVAFERKFSGR